MSHFYSSIQGGRGEATRCGDKSNGVRATAQSFTGSVCTRMFVGDDGDDWCEIEVAEGSRRCGGKSLYRGPIKRLLTHETWIPSFLPQT